MVIGNRATAPSGIPYVMVNGTLVVDGGVSQIGARPGQPIRYPPITEGEIDLDLNDKQYQWHADIPDSELAAAQRVADIDSQTLSASLTPPRARAIDFRPKAADGRFLYNRGNHSLVCPLH